ncbi:unnamed protein product [Sphagnum troendelagicum]|uniref:Uncharacterized protein n=1 Tax=Sphagnum troendelagicum TaxID=128251 RepID=A0ABP0V4Z4_9BRYO
MGNAIVKRTSKRARAAASMQQSMVSAKVMMIDGSVAEFKEPITVAELMMEYPQHLVCHSSAMQHQQQAKSKQQLQMKAALPADVQLELGRLYYLLPASKFQGPLQQQLYQQQQRAAAAQKKLMQQSNGSCSTVLQQQAKLSKLQAAASTRQLGELFINRLEIQQKNGRIEVSAQELQDGCNQLVHPLTGLRITRDDICVVPQSAGQDWTKQDEEEQQQQQQEEDEEPIVSFSTPDLRSMYMNAGANAGARGGAQPSLTRTSSWKPRLETIQEVGALSRRRFQNFVRGRRASRSQVHDHLNT